MERLLRKRFPVSIGRASKGWVGEAVEGQPVRESWWGLGCQSFMSSETKGEIPKEEEDHNDDSDTPIYQLTTP